jgi:hypothetical protein
VKWLEPSDDHNLRMMRECAFRMHFRLEKDSSIFAEANEERVHVYLKQVSRLKQSAHRVTICQRPRTLTLLYQHEMLMLTICLECVILQLYL